MNDYIEIQDHYDRGTTHASPGSLVGAGVLSGVMTRVYLWMAAALAITAGTAFLTISSPTLLQMIYGQPLVIWIFFAAELLLVISLSTAINRMSPTVATSIFLAYAAVNGFTLSSIFFVYSIGTITQAFAASALTFGAMSIFGATTKKDLSGLGGILIMALIGLIVASVVNIFWANSTMDAIITYAGVFIFVGLTAYDTQKIKAMTSAVEDSVVNGYGDASMPRKIAIIGALTLYLDFINLFIYILRLLGRNRD